MDLKDFLLDGGRISYSYKTRYEEWVGSVNIFIFAGYYKKPYIIIDGDITPIHFPLNEIEKAIDHYKSIVFNPVNIMYKMHETVCELCEKGEEIDLDNEETFLRVNTLRKAKILKSIRDVKSNS